MPVTNEVRWPLAGILWATSERDIEFTSDQLFDEHAPVQAHRSRLDQPFVETVGRRLGGARKEPKVWSWCGLRSGPPTVIRGRTRRLRQPNSSCSRYATLSFQPKLIQLRPTSFEQSLQRREAALATSRGVAVDHYCAPIRVVADVLVDLQLDMRGAIKVKFVPLEPTDSLAHRGAIVFSMNRCDLRFLLSHWGTPWTKNGVNHAHIAAAPLKRAGGVGSRALQLHQFPISSSFDMLRTERAMTTCLMAKERRRKRLGRWLPRQIAIEKSDEQIQVIVFAASLTPRKCLVARAPDIAGLSLPGRATGCSRLFGENRGHVHGPSQQQFLRHPFRRIVKGFEKLNISRGQHGRRYPVAVH